jgi:recombinational DNA repair ATPase RecF
MTNRPVPILAELLAELDAARDAYLLELHREHYGQLRDAEALPRARDTYDRVLRRWVTDRQRAGVTRRRPTKGPR